MAVNNYVAYCPEVEQKQEKEEDNQYIVEHMAQTHTQVFDKHVMQFEMRMLNPTVS